MQDPPGRWRALIILASAMLLGMTTWFSATAVVPQLRDLWTLTSAESAWMTIAVQLGFVVGALTSAVLNLADRVPPRRLMLYGGAGAALANLLLLAGPPVVLAILLRAVTGFCLASVYPPAMKAMATWFKIKRGTALGIMVGALTVGSAAPHLVNGLGGLDWRVVIFATSVMSLAGGLIAEYLGRDGPFDFPRAVFDPRKAWQAFSDRPVYLASIGYFGHMWELYAMWAWFSVFFADVLAQQAINAPLAWSAIATFVVIGVGAIGCWVGGMLGDRWGRGRATSLAMIISGSCAVIIGLIPAAAWPVVLVVGLVWGFWVVADSAQFSTVITELGDQSYVGTALTLQLAIGYVLTVPTLWLIPVVHEACGWAFAFGLLALGPVVGTIAMQKLAGLEARKAIH
ncbi:major facilitator superfamily protein [Salinisphaera dokdonensis CL-ES53]|uniref:Major facilitator superfamily protein n=1 Tax=Salinisphaera dokdonensis CL-ES53 TaxID=1304272 RepID=A0ABV2AZR5_9GAMM